MAGIKKNGTRRKESNGTGLQSKDCPSPLSQDIPDSFDELETVLNHSSIVLLKRQLLPSGSVDFVTKNICQFGYNADEFLSGAVSFSTIIHPDDISIIEAKIAAHLKNGAEAFTLRYRLITRAGEERWIEECAVPIHNNRGVPTHIHGVLLDNTARILLRNGILAVSEREQARMSHDLHDIVGQSLSGIAILTHTLQQDLAAQGLPQAAAAARLVKLLNDATAKTRQLSRGILPFDPSAKELGEAIEEYAAGIESLFGVPFCLDIEKGSVGISDNAAMQLYRIVQESVNNAVKHANASEITIVLKKTKGRTKAIVRDNGVGLPVGWEQSSGLGIQIMRHRAVIIGAHFAVRSGEGGGTIVTCCLNEASL